MLRPAVSVGVTDWVSLGEIANAMSLQAIQDCRVGASSAEMLPPQRALYLFSQMGYC